MQTRFDALSSICMNPKQLGRYEIIKLIGQGGMSTVYLAQDPRLQRQVAIKALHNHLNYDPQFAARFEIEAQVIARLSHHAVLPIYDVGSDEGTYYIVMRLFTGGTLRDKLRTGPLSVAETVKVLSPIADALDYAHQQGVIHRDVKPANIGFAEADKPILMDFGIAKLTADSGTLTGAATLGTPYYMAPEQANPSGQLGTATDIYALGIVAYETLTGQLPFVTESPVQMMMAHITSTPRPITSLRVDLPAEYDEIFAKVLAKEPDERFTTASAFINALRGETSNSPLPVSPTTNSTPLTPSPVVPSRTISVPVEPEFPAEPTLTEKIQALWEQSRRRVSSLFQRQTSTVAPPMTPAVAPPAPPLTPSEPQASAPPIPPTVAQAARPTLILQPQVQNLLAPVAQQTIQELMSHQEPERIVNYAVTFGGGRFIVTGYGSFGGTSLTKEICRSIQQQWATLHQADNEAVLIAQLTRQNSLAADTLTFRVRLQDQVLGTFSLAPAERPSSGEQHLYMLLDTFDDVLNRVKKRSSLREKVDRCLTNSQTYKRLVVTIDKANNPETVRQLLMHPVIERQATTLIIIVEQERFNRWPQQMKRRLQTQGKFQLWTIPCLWETDYQLVDSTMRLLFSRFQMNSPEASEQLQVFKKHIAYLGRGQVGTTLYELRQLRYWQIDTETRQAFIMLDGLDDELLKHHAWIQDLLDANWETILGTSFPGQARTDRAKQGVYALMDWIVDSSTFTLEEAIDEGSERPIWISPHKRLRDEVIFRLLDVLVKSNYLNRVENDFDIIWGRDVDSRVANAMARTVYAEQAVVWQQRLDDLMDDYQSASTQLSHAIDAVQRQRLQRHLSKLDDEITAVQQKLDGLQTSE